MDKANPILAQKIGLTPQDAAPGADAARGGDVLRQMRRALSRAADQAVRLSTVVTGIEAEAQDAEALIEGGPEGWIVLGLRDGDNAGLTGLFLLDPPLRSALVEMQTMGTLLPAAAEERKVTRTDAVMAVPFADALLKELADVGFGGGDVNPAGFDIGPMDDLRTAGLVMMQGNYRVWRVSIEIGGGERKGDLLIAMRPPVAAIAAVASGSSHWASCLRTAVEQAPTELDAVLTKMVLPISKIDALEVGQVMHLAGTTVGSITLVGPTGEPVASARLGQIAGKRAVRVEPSFVQMDDHPDSLTAAAPPRAAPELGPPQNESETAAPEVTASVDLVDG